MIFFYDILILLIPSFCSSSNKIFKHFIRNTDVIHRLDTYIKKPVFKDPIFLSGYYTSYKNEVCKSIAKSNNIPFIEYRYDIFMESLPAYKYNNSLIYITGMSVQNKSNKVNKLQYLYRTDNSVIFELDINKNILDFETIKFPEITNEDINNYIFDMIIYHKYNTNMVLLNWSSYNINHLNSSAINILLRKINESFKDNTRIEKLHKYMNSIIDEI
jgi:hypothetical protein